MADVKRQSPVRLDVNPLKSDVRDNWTVALAYGKEGQGPWLVDLAHKIRWDLQDGRIVEQTVCGRTIPGIPGKCSLEDNMLINRVNRTQASIYHLGEAAPVMPDFPGYTDVTESTVFLALFGPKIFFVAEKLTNLDVSNPGAKAPFLLQGPFCHIPCQIIVLEKALDGSDGFLLTCSRGYAESMVNAILKAGTEFGLRPAGEIRFNTYIRELRKDSMAVAAAK